MLGSPAAVEQEDHDGGHDDSRTPRGPHAGPSANLVTSESPLRKLARDAASACYNFIEPAVSYVHKALEPTVHNICTEFRKMIRVFKGWKQCSIEYKTKLAAADNATPSFRPYCDLNDRYRQNYRRATEEFHMPGSHFDGEASRMAGSIGGLRVVLTPHPHPSKKMLSPETHHLQ
jgi:hypothetical protein